MGPWLLHLYILQDGAKHGQIKFQNFLCLVTFNSYPGNFVSHDINFGLSVILAMRQKQITLSLGSRQTDESE